MLLEPLVLVREQRAPEFQRHVLRGREALLPILRDARREQRAVARLEHVRLRRREQRLGQQPPPEHAERNPGGGNRGEQPATRRRLLPPANPAMRHARCGPVDHLPATTSTHWPFWRACCVASY